MSAPLFRMDAAGMASNIEHREWMRAARTRPGALTPDERRRYNKSIVLPHPQIDEVRRCIEYASDHNQAGATRRLFVGVTGDYAAGKSQILEELALDTHQATVALLGETVTDDQVRSRVQPVLWVNAVASGEADLAQSICLAAGLPLENRSGQTAASMLHKAAAQCSRSKTSLGVIDDVNMLSSSNRREQLTHFCKRMGNDLPITLIFCGHGLLESPVFAPTSISRHADHQAAAQLSRRLITVKITAIPQSRGGLKQFAELVWSAYERFLFREPPAHADLGPQELGVLHKASGGRPGTLFTIMCAAAARAVEQEEKITLALINDAIAMLPVESTE